MLEGLLLVGAGGLALCVCLVVLYRLTRGALDGPWAVRPPRAAPAPPPPDPGARAARGRRAARAADDWGDPRRFGVELECFVPDEGRLRAALAARGVDVAPPHERARGRWAIRGDASLAGPAGLLGRELVSPPLAGAAGRAEVEDVLAALAASGAVVNATCGCHVHHDAADLDATALQALVASYARSRAAIEVVIDPARRAAARPRYARGWTRAERAAIAATVDRAGLAGAAVSRYHCVNLQALARHGTVEFRQHQGTLDPAAVVAWIRFGQALIAATAGGQVVDARTPHTLAARLGLDAATARRWTAATPALPTAPEEGPAGARTDAARAGGAADALGRGAVAARAAQTTRAVHAARAGAERVRQGVGATAPSSAARASTSGAALEQRALLEDAIARATSESPAARQAGARALEQLLGAGAGAGELERVLTRIVVARRHRAAAEEAFLRVLAAERDATGRAAVARDTAGERRAAAGPAAATD